MENIAWAELERGAGFVRYVSCGHEHKEARLADKCLHSFYKRLKKERPTYTFRVESGAFNGGVNNAKG